MRKEAPRKPNASSGGGPEEDLGGSGGGGSPPKFTGLGKEELLRAAAAPPWRKARTCLLLLFWLGWVGMLGAAAAIVAKAPSCRPLPPQHWWQQGALYRAPPKQFGGDLKGVAARLEHVASLGARGLILGPLHPQNASGGGEGSRLPPLEQLEPSLGSLQDFGELLQAAKRKGLQVLVDLTPTFGEGKVWGGLAEDPQFKEHMKGALSAWLQRGVGGFLLDGIEELPLSLVSEWQNLTQAQPSPQGGSRVLLGGSRLQTLRELQQLLETLGGAGGGPLLGRFQEALGDTPGPLLVPQLLSLLEPGVPLVWSVGSPWRHLAGLDHLRAPQTLLLLWTLPGTPALSYGDEIGLQDPPGAPRPGQLSPMPWERLQEEEEEAEPSQALQTPPQLLSLCRQLGALRSAERSLALGAAEPLQAGPGAAAFLRRWEQSESFLVLLNTGGDSLSALPLRDPRLPPTLTLRLSTHRALPPDPRLPLAALQLGPYEGLLLSFPHQP
ncbi:amino acid transporter heavy chain SLC3A2 [Pogoniulus pusillus]|uniref:amino acid transporter heavy chain SLC3A2 n=1 Tax=Pogoniulus pusillus TaxID=488313 RepID=UPI0030B964F3